MRLSQQDASFIYQETESGPMQTANIIVLEGNLTYEQVYEHYVKRIHLVPRLRQRLVFVPFNLGHPKWVDDPDFDVTNHFEHHEMPPGSSLPEGLDALCEINEGLMDRSRPLWKFHVLTGVRDRTLILQQIHHAMIDGASSVQMATVLLDFSPTAEEPPPAQEPWNPPPIQSPMELMAEAMQENLQANPTLGFAALADENNRDLIQKGMEAMSRFVREPVITAPWNASSIGPKRKIIYSVYPFAEFREIRRAFGGTINDIALAVASEGAARYLEAHGERTQGQRLRIMCPVNVRTEDETGALGNRVSAIFPTFPASSMPIIERYRAVCDETDRIKTGGEAQAMTLISESAPETPPVAMAMTHLVGTPLDPTRFAAQFPAPVPSGRGGRGPHFGANFVLTNVPGVQVTQYLAGHELLDNTTIMMMTGNMGLSVAVGSYNQKMVFNYTADPRMVPDLAQFDESCNQVYSELLAAARDSVVEQEATG